MVPWTERPVDGNRHTLVGKIRSILSLLSGNSIISMLNDLITKDERKIIAGKYHDALRNMSRPVNIVKSKNKHYFIYQLKLAGLTLNEVKNLGFLCGEKLWSSCKNTRERFHGGRPRMTTEMNTRIQNFMDEKSTISSFKSVYVRKRLNKPKTSKFEERTLRKTQTEKLETEVRLQNVRCRTTSLRKANDLFNEKMIELQGSRISYSAFRKCVTEMKRFKRPYNVNSI